MSRSAKYKHSQITIYTLLSHNNCVINLTFEYNCWP